MVFRFLQRLTVMNGYRNFSNVGFVGLGNMGNSMAKNLLKKGHKLTVYDTNKSVVMNLIEAGARGASSAEELSKESNIVITMLPTNDHVWDSYTGEKGLLRYSLLKHIIN
ncbi:hypothetical protein PV326_000153 [Microctonus aethiopoides]|nr:hypothetical protein PV326_000153 [Microctonus aethiopoides]